MTIVRFALVGLVAACAWAAWPHRPTIIDTHTATRKFVIRSTLDRVTDPVIIIGDSIVEGSTLPRLLCGRPVVNAGIGGLSTTTALSDRLSNVLAGTRAALIVVSLGTNDAARPNSVEAFRTNYSALLAQLKTFAQHSAVAKIPPAEAGLPEARKVDAALTNDYNAALPGIAAGAGATFIDFPEMPVRHTFDGIHLNAAGYGVWEKAISDGIESTLCKPKGSS